MSIKIKLKKGTLLVDSHCHLDTLNYDDLHQDIDSVLQQAREQDVGMILSVATTLEGFKNMITQIGIRSGVVFSCGVHPLYVNQGYSPEELQELASTPNVVALGETGLDYYYQIENRQQQLDSFRYHIELCKELAKPLIVHTRNAKNDTLALLKEGNLPNKSGVLHCFTEDKAMATKLLDLGFYISFSGIITFRNAHELREVAKYIPLERILVETDSPYLAPIPYRGKENQPAYVREVAQCLASLRGMSLEELATATTENFCQLFKITAFNNRLL